MMEICGHMSKLFVYMYIYFRTAFPHPIYIYIFDHVPAWMYTSTRAEFCVIIANLASSVIAYSRLKCQDCIRIIRAEELFITLYFLKEVTDLL